MIGPDFIDENLTENTYLELLENVIYPLLFKSLEDQSDDDGNMFLEGCVAFLARWIASSLFSSISTMVGSSVSGTIIDKK